MDVTSNKKSKPIKITGKMWRFQSMDLSRFWLSCLDSFVYLFTKTFKLFTFSKIVVCLWAYVVKVIPETRVRTKFEIYVFVPFHWVDTSAGELIVSEGIIRPVVGASAWLITYIFMEIYSS